VPACRVVTYWLYSQSCAGECIDDITAQDIHTHIPFVYAYARVLHNPADRIISFCETSLEKLPIASWIDTNAGQDSGDILSCLSVSSPIIEHDIIDRGSFFSKQCTVNRELQCREFFWLDS